MPTINRQNFPGVYTQIIDQSFSSTTTARFRPGLIGVASKGPFNTPTQVRTVQDFVRLFGQPVTDSFLGTAVGVVAPYTDGSTVVRVGQQYQSLPSTGTTFSVAVSGTLADNHFDTNGASFLTVGNYVQIEQDGKLSTVNAQVSSITLNSAASGTSVVVSGVTLKDSYTSGVVKFSPSENAASKAQSELKGYAQGALVAGLTVSGDKGNYYFTTNTAPTSIDIGSLYEITETLKATTREVYVTKKYNQVNGKYVVEIQTTDDTARGYQALPLQDSYVSATIRKIGVTQRAALVYALTEGEWANTTGSNPTTGLQVTVSPGTAAGTKKLNVYSDSSLVEVYDNIADSPASYDLAVNSDAPSSYIRIKTVGTLVPANTANPWDTTATGAITAINTARDGYTDGGSFDDGHNGEHATAADYVGTLNPIDDTMTGLKAFEDLDNVNVNIICAPGVTSADSSMTPVHTQLRDTAKAAKARGIIDAPQFGLGAVALNPWAGIDWSNGDGQFKAKGRLDTPYLACFYNWFDMNDPITQVSRRVPPTIGVLRAMGFTWLHDQPWYVAAGDNRGVIDEATGIAFDRISKSAKEAMTAPGNCLNLIFKQDGQIKVFGDRTMQRQNSAMSDLHTCVLVDYILRGLSLIARRYVFDPNDMTLLTSLNTEMTQFLDSVKNLHGIETYKLVCDTSNNRAENRNRREVIVDLSVIPVSAAERIYLSALVNKSGAELTGVTA